MKTVILWDVDGTLLNFKEAEFHAIRNTFEAFSLPYCTDEMIRVYSALNDRYWKMLERKEISKADLLVKRFEEFFAMYDINDVDCTAFNHDYQMRLGDTIVFCDDGYEVVRTLKKKGYRQYAITNGTKIAQDKKLNRSGFIDLFDDVFISEDIGYEKPDVKFFEEVFERINERDTARMIVVGDSLTSDIRGANNAGIDACWYNPDTKKNDTECIVQYEIRDLHELYEILEVER